MGWVSPMCKRTQSGRGYSAALSLCDEVPLAKISGFQVDSAGIGLNCRAAEPGTRGSRFHFAERRTGSERPGSAMKFVLAFYGTRGDVEPGLAVGRELLRRGHDVRMAVPPDLVGFAEAAGPAAVACGPDVRAWQDMNRDFWARFLRNFWKNFWRIRDLIGLMREYWQLFTQCWQEVS